MVSGKITKLSSSTLAAQPSPSASSSVSEVQQSNLPAPIDQAVRFASLNLDQNENLNDYMELEGGNVGVLHDHLVEDVNQDQENNTNIISNEAIAEIINNSIAPIHNIDHNPIVIFKFHFFTYFF